MMAENNSLGVRDDSGYPPIIATNVMGSATGPDWTELPSALGGFDADANSDAVFACTLAVGMGAVTLVLGLMLGGLVTAILCSIIAICAVGLAAAML